MKIHFWAIGKTNEKYLREGIGIFTKRLGHYLPFEMQELPDIKQAGKLSPVALKEKEGEMVLQRLKSDDYLILLDERGKRYTSEAFARQINKWLQLSQKRIIFLVGGAYGFSTDLYQRANQKIALSEMTFSHQMVRLFFVEQLYRGMSILRNQPYHNG